MLGFYPRSKSYPAPVHGGTLKLFSECSELLRAHGFIIRFRCLRKAACERKRQTFGICVRSVFKGFLRIFFGGRISGSCFDFLPNGDYPVHNAFDFRRIRNEFVRQMQPVYKSFAEFCICVFMLHGTTAMPSVSKVPLAMAAPMLPMSCVRKAKSISSAWL